MTKYVVFRCINIDFRSVNPMKLSTKHKIYNILCNIKGELMQFITTMFLTSKLVGT